MMKKLLYQKFTLVLLLMSISANIILAQVSGTVTSGDDGTPLIGANVVIKGTSNGGITDLDGKFQVDASQGDVLVFSYTGMLSQEITVSGSTIDVQLSDDVTTLNDIVVSATRRPVRKLQATTSINSIGTRELETKQAESFTEAIENTPGVSVNNSQGRKGGFNIRGFPGGNVYTTTLIDGLPASAISNLSSGTQEFYGLDPNVERIEVVRGAAATLFGRAAAAGAVNIISRTGGAKHGGSASLTRYSNVANEGHQFEGDFDFRADINLNGPISDKWRYNIGGYIINDSGTKEQAHKDKGAQIRGNFDWLISKTSSIRFSAGYLNNQFQNLTDSAWDLERNSLPDGWNGASVFFNDASALDAVRTAASGGNPVLDASGNPITNNPGEVKEKAWGGNFGIDANIDLGNGWALVEKLKYQSFQWNDINELSFTGFFTTESSAFRFLGGAIQQNESFISETRIQKLIENDNAIHSISAGIYYGNGNRDRLGLNYSYFSTISPRPVFSGFGGSPLSSTFSISGTTSHRQEVSTGIFIGDEMVFNDKLSVNVALRYDWLTGSFSNNPDEIRSRNLDYDPASPAEIDLKFSDFSGSIGFNYLLGETSAFYANYLRAFSLPSVGNINSTVPENNEIINNVEVGYRAGLGDVTMDVTVFNTKINNRVATIFDADLGEFVQRPSGSNKVFGGELSLAYTPKAIKGLLIRSSFTYQNSEYVDFVVPLSVSRSTGEPNADLNNLFGLPVVGTDALAVDIEGKKVQETPRNIFNINIGYNSKRWGADFGGYTYSGMYADIFNLYDLPNTNIYNIGAYVKFPLGSKGNELKFSMRVKNVFDAATPQDLFVSSNNDSALLERQRNPDPTGRLAWAVIQPPRRVLFTLGYTF